MARRGFDERENRIVPNDLPGVVGSYLHYPSTPRASGRNGLLFYHREGEAVCGYLWRGGVPADGSAEERAGQADAPLSFRLPVESPAGLAGLIEEARLALAAGGATAMRAPRLRDPSVEGVSRGATPLQMQPTPAERLGRVTARLSQVLFAGIGHLVEDLDSLSIVPALNIGTVPFAALDPDGDGVPLAASVAINIEASLGDVLDGNVFVVRPHYRPQTIAGDPDASGDPDWIFPRLPGAAAEARSAAVRFGTEPVLGDDATIAEVTGRLASSAYIHIAAHGLSDPQDPIDGSFLALSDGRLTARHIQAMRLGRSPIVVLSACQTGLGGALDAGIIGLARAFMLAGASSVVSSLWNVDDQATAWIMERFLLHLDANPPAAALRLAQDEARTRWPHPSVWASFVLFGGRSVVLERPPERSVFAGDEVSISFRLRREGAFEAGSHGALAFRPGDEVHATVVNDTASPLTVDFVYLAARDENFLAATTRLGPASSADVPLVRMDGGAGGRSAILTLVRHADPRERPGDIDGLIEGAPGLLMLRNLVEPSSMPALFPEGVHPLGGFGAPEPGVNVPLSRDVGRGALFVAPLLPEG